MISFGQIADWVLKNRKNKVFKDQTFEQICSLLNKCANDLTMICVTDMDDIVGLVCAKKDCFKRTMFICEILTTREGVLKQMLEWFKLNYPGYTLEALRRGRFVKYNNIDKLLNKI